MAKKPKSKTTKKAIKKNAAKLRRKALSLWTQVVIESGGHKCAICGVAHGTLNKNGKPIWINCHHIEDKCNYATRWDPRNGICLCPNCHKFCNPDSAHRSPVWFLDWLRKNRPGTEEYIMEARNARPHTALEWTTENLEALVLSLSERLSKLMEGKPKTEIAQATPVAESSCPEPDSACPPPSQPVL
jgi:hypothetical protein